MTSNYVTPFYLIPLKHSASERLKWKNSSGLSKGMQAYVDFVAHVYQQKRNYYEILSDSK